jgi:drug/metabolite transporter (DMT)-like permease
MTIPQREPRVLLGIGFMLLAASILPVMNGLVQWLSPRYPSEQIVWARITGHFLIMLAVMLPTAGLRVFATRRPLLQFGRSALQVISTGFNFTAVATLPLVKATAIGFTSPFIVALLAWPMLGERPKLNRLLAVAAAFCGVLVVIRPGSAAFQPASLLALGSATAYALYQVLTRQVAPHDRPETSALFSAILGTVLLSLAAPFFWTPIASLGDAIALLALGAIGAGGHYCVARAMTYAPAAVISPFHYWQIIGATVMGVLLTGLWPDGMTWLGAGIVIGAGLYLAFSEGRASRRRQA